MIWYCIVNPQSYCQTAKQLLFNLLLDLYLLARIQQVNSLLPSMLDTLPDNYSPIGQQPATAQQINS